MTSTPAGDDAMSIDKPFRFLDLPAELRIIVYEDVAYNTHLKPYDSHWPNTSIPLLRTCKLIRKEYEPVLYNLAAIELPVADWQFRHVKATIAKIQANQGTAKALAANDRFTVTITAEVWTEKHLKRVESWLKARLSKPAVDVKYNITRPLDGFHWKSKSQFLWMTGVEELRQLQQRVERVESAVEVGKIIEALEQEAHVLERSGSAEVIEKRRRQLEGSYATWSAAGLSQIVRGKHCTQMKPQKWDQKGQKKGASRKWSSSEMDTMLADLARRRLQGGV